MNDKGGTKMEKTKLTHLLEQMTIDEKIDQLLQLAAAFYSDKAEEKTGPMSDLGLTQETINNAGTTLGVSGAQRSDPSTTRIHQKQSPADPDDSNGRYYPWVSNNLPDSIGSR